MSVGFIVFTHGHEMTLVDSKTKETFSLNYNNYENLPCYKKFIIVAVHHH